MSTTNLDLLVRNLEDRAERLGRDIAAALHSWDDRRSFAMHAERKVGTAIWAGVEAASKESKEIRLTDP